MRESIQNGVIMYDRVDYGDSVSEIGKQYNFIVKEMTYNFIKDFVLQYVFFYYFTFQKKGTSSDTEDDFIKKDYLVVCI